jgi:3-hydroxyacyl-[acyl-carrier-protein] dehydratase
MPGVLIVEALAQTGAVAVLSEEENRGKLAFFAGIDDCRFKRVVEPGDVLELRCELERVRGPIGRGKAEARVDGELACKATLTFAVERQMRREASVRKGGPVEEKQTPESSER